LSNVLIQNLCKKALSVCKKIIETIVETKVTDRTDYNLIPDLFYYEPGGTSIKNLLHWIQIYHNQKLAFYDYGNKKNMEVYKEPNPPIYNMSHFEDYSIPSFITRSDSDPFSSLEDVNLWLNYAKYDKKKDIINVLDLTNYNHLDYMWSIDAYEDIYKKVIKFVMDEKEQ
jgi:lysosomal acid lipase/cholesteryl ester hydrolase/gastric triacylglycerol lipase